ncbi:MAG: thioredoxin [Vulcanimicrobiota bacterium]
MSNAMEVTDNTFQKEVIEADKTVLVDFWAPWCGPCRMMAPVVDTISAKLEAQLKVVKLNTDENQKTSETYGIQGIPSLLIFKKGEVVERLVGFMPENVLMEKVKLHLA